MIPLCNHSTSQKRVMLFAAEVPIALTGVHCPSLGTRCPWSQCSPLQLQGCAALCLQAKHCDHGSCVAQVSSTPCSSEQSPSSPTVIKLGVLSSVGQTVSRLFLVDSVPGSYFGDNPPRPGS